MTTASKRKRRTNQELQEELWKTFREARRLKRINAEDLPQQHTANVESGLYRLSCPWGNCAERLCGVDEFDSDDHDKYAPQFALVYEGWDEQEDAPLKFKLNESSRKLLEHVRKRHGYDDCSNDCDEFASSARIISIPVTEAMDLDDTSETECGYFSQNESETSDACIDFEDLDSVDTEPVSHVSMLQKPCHSTFEFSKYMDATIGADMATGYVDNNRLTLRRLLCEIIDIELKYSLPKECVQDIITLVRRSMGGEPKEQFIMPPSVHLLRSVIEMDSLKSK